MGGISADGSNKVYLSVSKGQLVWKKKGGEIVAQFYAFEGRIISIERKDDNYEGKPISKIHLLMRDDKEDHDTEIQFIEDSYFSLGFFQRVEKANLERPIILGVSKSEQNEKISFCWMKQDGVILKRPEPAPFVPTKVTKPKGRNETEVVTDWTNCFPHFDRITKWINDTLWRGAPEESNKSTAASTSTSGGSAPVEDDLPF